MDQPDRISGYRHLTEYHDLEEAHEQWEREFSQVRSTLRYEDLLAVAERVDEVFTRFLKALESQQREERARGGRQAARSQAPIRPDPGAGWRTDLRIADACFVALMSSAEILNRGEGRSIDETTHRAIVDAARAYRQLAHDVLNELRRRG